MIWWAFLTIPIVFITFILTGVFKKKNTDPKQASDPPTDEQNINRNKNKEMKNIKLRGLATISFYADDHEKAKKWYSEVFGMEPYFNVPGYTEFRLGDYQHELGIIDGKFAPKDATKEVGGAIAYWHVDELQETLDLLLSKGAKLFEPVTDRSGGKMAFVTASVVDPFGNILGIMSNQHYLGILKKKIEK